MKARIIPMFYLFLAYSIHCWAIRGQQGFHRYVSNGVFSIVIFINVTLLRDIGILVFKVDLIPLPPFPNFNDQGLLVVFMTLVYCVISHVILSHVRLLEISESEKMKDLYKRMGFKNYQSIIYVIVSFVLLFYFAGMRK